MKPEDVPAELVRRSIDALLAVAARDATAALPEVSTRDDRARALLAAVLPAHERQVREQTLRDLNAGSITNEDLAAAGLDTDHIVDLRADGWTIRHPLTCRTDLFACPVNRAAERDLTGPPHEFGRFECGVENGEFWIGEVR